MHGLSIDNNKDLLCPIKMTKSLMKIEQIIKWIKSFIINWNKSSCTMTAVGCQFGNKVSEIKSWYERAGEIWAFNNINISNQQYLKGMTGWT